MLLHQWAIGVSSGGDGGGGRQSFKDTFSSHCSIILLVQKLHTESVTKRTLKYYIDLEGRRNSRVIKALRMCSV